MAIINGVGRVGIRNYVAPSTSTNPLWNSLVAYYTGDNTSNDTKGTANGTLVNGATYATGKINNGFSLDGINDYVNFGNNLDFSGLTPFSFNFWVNPNAASGFQVLFCKWDATEKGYLIRKSQDGNYLNFVVGSGGSNYSSTSNNSIPIPSNVYTMVTVAYVPSQMLKIYINGVSDTLTNHYNAFSTSASNTANLTSGAWSTGASYFYGGKIDEVGVWNRAITATEVTELYNTGAGKQYIATTPTYTARTTSFAAATGITDTTILNALNTFDTGLISNGLDTKMKALYPFVGGTAATHKFNFMDARDLDTAFRLQFNGGWTHSSTGALPNGTNAYANTYITPSTNLDADNLSMSYYSRTNTSVIPTQILFSSFVNSSSVCALFFDSNILYFDSFNNTPYIGRVSVSESRSQGMYMGNRLNASINKIVRNGTVIASFATGGTGIRPTFSIYMAAANYQGSAVAFNSLQTAFGSIGNGLTDGEATTFYNLVQAFQTSLGRQV